MHNPGIDERKVHFIGIGGISMSGLAMILMTWGIPVSGSDRVDAPVLERLRKLGADVFVGHRAGQHGDASLVVYTPAITDDNEELAAARAHVKGSGSAPQRVGGQRGVVPGQRGGGDPPRAPAPREVPAGDGYVSGFVQEFRDSSAHAFTLSAGSSRPQPDCCRARA